MSSTALRRIAISLILIATTFGLNGKASGPAPPQAQEQPGQPITLEVDAHSSLFADPLWSSGSQGTCRYLTNPSSSEWFVPIGSQAEWQSMETSSDNQYSENYASQQVCCRPSTGTQNATLCASASGGPQSAQIVGSDSTSYGLLGSTGSATATCSNPPYGDYVETQTFTCVLDPTKPSTGVGADGAWSAETGDTRTCQPNAYSTYGSCSATCDGGNLYETVYNSCGQITYQGYSGPSCNTQSCCTPVYSYACEGASYVGTDTKCGTGSFIAGTCTLQSNNYGYSCSPSYSDSYPDGTGCTISYDQCSGSWGCSGAGCAGCSDVQCQEELTYVTCNGVTNPGGYTCPIIAQSCTSTYWAPP